ncbi:hypothetical protein FS842_002681 [Serendipita sp. 407]|nr:hypothetical protein FS842_002681 [Serendipita sp. 407]
MPPSLIADPPPEEPHSRAKNVIRILFLLWHLLITYLLCLIVFTAFTYPPIFDSRHPYNLYTLYLIPLVVYNLVFTLIQLFKIDGSRFLPRPLNFGIFARIRFRAYLYQVAAAIPLSQGSGANPVEVFLAYIVWLFGIWMFILGCIAGEFGFLDWIQEVQREEEEGEQQRIRLPVSSDDEGDEGDLFENTARRRRGRPRRAKTLVRNVIHIWDLLTVLLLVPIALISFFPRNPAYNYVLGVYVIPMMIFSLAYSLVWLCKKKEDNEARKASGTIIKTFLTRRQFGFFSRIRVRGFIYQAFAAIPLSHPDSPEASIAWLVWVSGVGMFVLGCIANECGFLDWVQEEEGKEDSFVPVFASSDEEGDEESNVGNHESTMQATGEHPDTVHV